MKFRLLLIASVVMLLAGMIFSVGAQDAPFVPCGDLSAADCDELTAAFVQTSEATSAAFTIDGAISIPGQMAMEITLTADGSFSGAPVMSVGTNATTLAASANPLAMLNADSLDGFSGELNLSIGGLESTLGSESLELQLALVDGIGYINFGALSESLGAMGTQLQLPEGWAGTDLGEALEMFAGMAAGAMEDMPEQTVMSPEQMEGLMQYYTVTRDGDTFTMSVNMAGMMSDPVMQEMLEAQGSANNEASQAVLEGFEDATFEISYTLVDGYIGEMGVLVEIDGSSMDLDGLFVIDLTIAFSEIGTAAPVTAPEGATVVPFMQAMQAFGGMMQ